MHKQHQNKDIVSIKLYSYVAVGLTVQIGAVPEGTMLVGEGPSLGTYSTFTTVGITPPVCSLKLLCPITSRILQFHDRI